MLSSIGGAVPALLQQTEEVMTQLIARVVSTSARARAGARLSVALRRSGATAFSLLADRALGA
ncbi:MAG TPA: hypothetical protein VF446_18195 [Trinickia sp.]